MSERHARRGIKERVKRTLLAMGVPVSARIMYWLFEKNLSNS